MTAPRWRVGRGEEDDRTIYAADGALAGTMASAEPASLAVAVANDAFERREMLPWGEAHGVTWEAVRALQREILARSSRPGSVPDDRALTLAGVIEDLAGANRALVEQLNLFRRQHALESLVQAGDAGTSA